MELTLTDIAGNRTVAGPYAISVRTPVPSPEGEPAALVPDLQSPVVSQAPGKVSTVALHNGRFHASYRFTSTFSTARYRFRAVIHDDDHFPYAGGTSPVVKVVVSP